MKLILIILLAPSLAFSQKNIQLDSIAINTPDSLTIQPQQLANYINQFTNNDYEKVRVIYSWVAHHIKYEETISENDSLKNLDLVMYSLNTKQGVCKNYSALFTILCSLVGIESYSVLGYTKINNQFVLTKDHAWNIAKIEGDYFLFDPTWDANCKSFNPKNKEFEFCYFMNSSNDFIKTHMPYDPVMQLTNYPIKHNDFFKGKTKGKTYLNYQSELKIYYKLNELDKLKTTLSRAQSNGIEITELNFLYNKLKFFVKQSIDNHN